jgi:hypothetical protein
MAPQGLSYVDAMAELSDEEVRRFIEHTYASELDGCRRLLEFAITELHAWSGRAVKRGADRIIIAEGARATKTFAAVTRLCELGFGEQASMLNRSLFEGMAVAHWVAEHRREAVGFFSRHQKFSALLWYETLERLGWLDETDRARRPRVGPKKRAEFVGLFGQFGTAPWVRRNLPTVIREIEHMWDERGRAQLWEFHDVPHRHANQMLHSSVTAVGATTVGATRDALHLTMGPSNQLVSQALLSGFWMYGQVFGLLRDVFKLKKADVFRTMFDAGYEAFRT